jgi:GNAT superfamily N-acetyltransferase
LRSLVIVRSDEEWKLKLRLHQEIGAFPDGHAYPPARWISLERAKVEAGYMEMAMVVREGVPLGAVGVAQHGPLLRLKNLFVSPSARGLGFGEWLTQYCLWRALHGGREAFGCFGIEGRDGDRLYRRCGLKPVGRQVGWSLALEPAQDVAHERNDVETVP